MILKNLNLINFRNYDNLEVELSPNINIIYGNNAQGKTNFLESIYVLAFTKSHRCLNDDSLIRKNCDFFKICGSYIDNELSTNLEIINSNKTKKYYIDNNNIKSMADYISKLKVIIFFPEDLDLIKGSPIGRRRYLNMEISQIDSCYYKILNDYNKLLKIRNDLLKDYLKNNNINNEYFDIITSYLIDKQVIIYKMRKKYVDRVNSFISDIYYNISGFENFKIEYVNNTKIDDFKFENLKKTLIKKFKDIGYAEKKVGSTLIGPHRDDIQFLLNNKNLKEYGSQGQQRMAILSFKLAEIKIIEKYLKDSPILLLDDVFSELDGIKRNNLLNYLCSNIQTIITTTELDNLDSTILKNAKLFKIIDGKIIN